MLKVKNKRTTPPGGWRDVEPSRQYPFIADHFEQLVDKERTFLNLNRLPVPDNLAAQIEDRLCHRMPKGICEDEHKRQWGGSFTQVASGNVLNRTITLAGRGSRFVSVNQANERAELCAKCSMRVPHRGCIGCRGIKATLKGLVGNRITETDNDNFICDALGIFLKVLVHLESIPVDPANSVRLTKECWLK